MGLTPWFELGAARGASLAPLCISSYPKNMSTSILDNSKKRGRGRPSTGGPMKMIGVRMPTDEIIDLDAWIAKQADKPSRPEALRRLARQALTGE
jgi:hypothetical protein